MLNKGAHVVLNLEVKPINDSIETSSPLFGEAIAKSTTKLVCTTHFATV